MSCVSGAKSWSQSQSHSQSIGVYNRLARQYEQNLMGYDLGQDGNKNKKIEGVVESPKAELGNNIGFSWKMLKAMVEGLSVVGINFCCFLLLACLLAESLVLLLLSLFLYVYFFYIFFYSFSLLYSFLFSLRFISIRSPDMALTIYHKFTTTYNKYINANLRIYKCTHETTMQKI